MRGGGNCPPLLPKDGPRDSFKIEEKMMGYRFCTNLSEKWSYEITQLNYLITLLLFEFDLLGHAFLKSTKNKGKLCLTKFLGNEMPETGPKTLDQVISNIILTQRNAQKRSLSRLIIKEIGC